VTLTGVFLTFRAALAQMRPGGRLIAVASIASLKGAAGISAYAAAKHGVLGLVRSVAREVARKGITCNAICPGYVDTPMGRQAVSNVQARYDLDEEAAIARLMESTPVGRLITPEECAAAVLYLASDAAAMVNGHALAMSGGET
jgi:NAD(P)-dependent dehydrogenase (short-subunit alcohol dehydrogenase family)